MKPKREPVNYRKLKAALDSPQDGPGEQGPGEVAGGGKPGRDDPKRVRERVVVKPTDCIAAFSIVGGVIIERELVDEAGRPCNSVGQPLPVGKAGRGER